MRDMNTISPMRSSQYGMSLGCEVGNYSWISNRGTNSRLRIPGASIQDGQPCNDFNIFASYPGLFGVGRRLIVCDGLNIGSKYRRAGVFCILYSGSSSSSSAEYHSVSSSKSLGSGSLDSFQVFKSSSSVLLLHRAFRVLNML